MKNEKQTMQYFYSIGIPLNDDDRDPIDINVTPCLRKRIAIGYNQLIYQQLCLQLKSVVRHGNTSLIEKGTQPEYGIVATRTRSHSYK